MRFQSYLLTLPERVGFVRFGSTQLGPYYRAAVGQFAPERRTLTQRLIDKVRIRRMSRKPQ